MNLQHQEATPGNSYRSNLRIVVAEQDTAAREALIDRIYDTLGVYADACNTARSVAKIIEAHPGETVLAVVDTRLPDAPEGEVLDLLTQAQVPTIAISPEVTPEVANRLVDKHIVDCILKRGDEDLDIITDLVERTLLNHKRKILLLSRSDFSRRAIRQMLDIHRYSVIDVRNETDVRRQLGNHPDISLVLLDQSAIELGLISELRQQYRKEDMAIAGVCDQREPKFTARLLRAGLNDVICRPHQADEFYCRVRHCVESIERVREIKFSSTHDRLTGLHNRDFLFDVGEKTYASAERGDIELAVALIEIDRFDSITLQHGNDAADTILTTIAPIIRTELRKNDIIARYHTATFACLASNVSISNAHMVFERVRQLIASTSVLANATGLKISVSIGIETSLQTSFRSMLGQAHNALMKAQQDGANRIVVTEASD